MKKRIADKHAKMRHMSARPIVCLPDTEQMDPRMLTLGLSLRALIAFCGVWGLMWLLNDAFRLQVSPWLILPAALLPMAWLTVMSLSKKAKRIGLAAGGGVLLAALILSAVLGAPFQLPINGILSLLGGIFDRLSGRGFIAPDSIPLLPSGVSKAGNLVAGFAMLGLLLSLLFAACLLKRTRVWPVVTVGAVVCITVFTYNLSKAKWALGLIIFSLCGILGLKLFHSLFDEKKASGTAEKKADGAKDTTARAEKEARKSRKKTVGAADRTKLALGGYSGFAALLLAVLIMIVPLCTMTEPWQEIPAIYRPTEYARAALSSVLIGDLPNRADLGYYANLENLTVRPVTAVPRRYYGEDVLEVQADMGTPMYLRSFTAQYYDENAWYSADFDDINAFRDAFPADFSPEQLTYRFYEAVNPALVTMPQDGKPVRHAEQGFNTVTVHMKALDSRGNLLFVPSSMAEGIGAYGEVMSKHEKAEPYYDGIYLTSWFDLSKQYSAVAFLPSYRSSRYADEFAAMLDYYRANLSAIRAYQNGGKASTLASMLRAELPKHETPTALFDSYLAMSEAEQAQFTAEHITLSDQYTAYVNETYLELGDFSRSYYLPYVTEMILEEKQADLDRGKRDDIHTTVMAVIDYLCDNYTYTDKPKQGKWEGQEPIDVFLGETKEGYSVQFASAATMLLRSFGIPTRYCEGLLIPSFSATSQTEAEPVARYYATASSRNAHAWIEVYVENVGWITYETTPEYYSLLYPTTDYTPPAEYDDPPYVPPDIPDVEEPEETTPPETSLPMYDEFGNLIDYEGDETKTITFESILGAGLVIGGVILAFVLLKRRSDRAQEERAYLFATSHEGGRDEQQRRINATALADYIMILLKEQKLVPATGELPSEFAVRVDAEIGLDAVCLAAVMPTVGKAEFGGNPTADELRQLAKYAETLYRHFDGMQNIFSRLYYRHIRCIL